MSSSCKDVHCFVNFLLGKVGTYTCVLCTLNNDYLGVYVYCMYLTVSHYHMRTVCICMTTIKSS